MSIDLHIHTTASDGTTSPVEVIELAKMVGLKTIALADHESTEGYTLVKELCKKENINIIPAIELLTDYKGKEIHLLGYFMDIENQTFQNRISRLRTLRTNCAHETVEKLIRQGFNITWEDVTSISYLGGPISKGHIMHAIYNAGYIRTKEDGRNILNKYLNNHGLAYTCYDYPFPEAVELIINAGGIPVLAHPGLIGDDRLIPELLQYGVKGMEVYYYYFNDNRAELINRYLAIANKYNLLITGGSDYHGNYAPVPLGAIQVPDNILEPLYNYKF